MGYKYIKTIGNAINLSLTIVGRIRFLSNQFIDDL
jgi:uncharacterized ferritin-like protein (DUF455 family)